MWRSLTLSWGRAQLVLAREMNLEIVARVASRAASPEWGTRLPGGAGPGGWRSAKPKMQYTRG